MDFNLSYVVCGHRAYTTKDARTYMVSDEGGAVLSEPVYAEILAQLDGRHDCGDVVQALARRHRPERVYLALTRLAAQGYIAPIGPPLDFVSARSAPDPSSSTPSWRLSAADPHDAGWVSRALRAGGLAMLSPQQPATARTHELVVCHDYDDPRVEARVRQLLARGQRCLPLRVAEPSLWLGPALGGDAPQQPCWSCLIHAIRHNRPVERFLGQRGAAAVGSPTASRATLARALHRAARALREPIEPPDALSLTTHSLLRIDLATNEPSWHIVRRRPQCPECGDPELFARQVQAPIHLHSRPARFSRDGGFRTVDPERTWSRMRDVLSPITGAITQLQPIGEQTSGGLRHVYGAAYYVHPPAEQRAEDESFIRAAFGKGRTAPQARASALGEALERFAAIAQGDEPIVRGPLRELEPAAIDPRQLLCFSEAQYASPDRAPDLAREGVPRPFDPAQPIDWTPAWSLTHDQPRLLPASYCYGFRATPPEERVCGQNSNGHAAGNCREEAVLQGLLELIERDAVAIWWYNRLLRPAVDLASFDDAYFAAVERHYDERGWELWVLDLTHDLEIPVVVAVIRQRETGRYIVGFGAHLEARLAIQRALTEVHQVLAANEHGPGLWTEDELEAPEFLRPDPAAAPRSAAELPTAPSDDLLEAITHCRHRLEAQGLELVVLDYTRPDLPLHTVKVVVPGLRHFWPRFAPGRLYDVPVALGWLPTARREHELNPKPLLL